MKKNKKHRFLVPVYEVTVKRIEVVVEIDENDLDDFDVDPLYYFNEDGEWMNNDNCLLEEPAERIACLHMNAFDEVGKEVNYYPEFVFKHEDMFGVDDNNNEFPKAGSELAGSIKGYNNSRFKLRKKDTEEEN